MASQVEKFIKKHYKKGYDLIDITSLCETRLGSVGWCNSFNEPVQECYFIEVLYRDETIININAKEIAVVDEDKHAVFVDDMEGDFIIFKKCKVDKNAKNI